MVVPTRRAVALLAGVFPLALLPALAGAGLVWAWAVALAAAAAALAVDLVLGASLRRLALEARAPVALYVGERDALRLELRLPGRRATDVEVVCDLDAILQSQPVARVRAGPDPSPVDIPLVPRRRGTAVVEAAWLRWRGPFGLLQWSQSRHLGLSVPVLPNLRAVRGAAIRFFGSRQFLSGLKVERFLGDGSEFESLREHTAGLDPRWVDWKASARHHKLMGREYRAERNHPMVMALDTGHLMAEPLAGIPKLDHAINASLLLAYVALKTGDRVGLFAFDERVRLYAEPQGGVASFARLQRHSAALDYSRAETNFTLGLLELGQRLRRRSLVVVLTDFVDTVTAELMVENLARLGRGHLVIFVALQDAALAALAGAEPRNLDALSRALTAHDLVREREVVLSRLRRQGVHCIDGPPASISTQLINRYLEVKRRELL
jgi:uncharacterized protein (DUF58 family)